MENTKKNIENDEIEDSNNNDDDKKVTTTNKNNDDGLKKDEDRVISTSPYIKRCTYKGAPVKVIYETYAPPPKQRRVDANNNNIIEEEDMYQCVECYNFGIIGEDCGMNGCGGVFAGHYMDKEEQIMARKYLKEKDDNEADDDRSNKWGYDSDNYYPEVMEDYDRPRKK